MPIEGERAKRIIVAVLQNIDNWRMRAEKIADDTPPGEKIEALSLARDIAFAHVSLCRLAEMEGEGGCPRRPEAAADAPTEGWSREKPPDA